MIHRSSTPYVLRRVLPGLILAAAMFDTGCTAEEMRLVLSMITPPAAPAPATHASGPSAFSGFDPLGALSGPPPFQLASAGPVTRSPGFTPFSEPAGDFGPPGSGFGGGGPDFDGGGGGGQGPLGPPGDTGRASGGALDGGASFGSGM